MKNDLTNIMNFGYFIRNLTMVCCIEMVILIPTFTIIICSIYKRIYKMKYKIRYTMTYKEFKKKIEEMGLVCDYSCYVISVFGPDYRPLAYINQTTINSMSTISTVSQLSETTSYKLLTLCYEMAKTPIDERGGLE